MEDQRVEVYYDSEGWIFVCDVCKEKYGDDELNELEHDGLDCLICDYCVDQCYDCEGECNCPE